ncbi:MAG: LuxR C-terminal-related transcriptional regulator [Bifidobacterium tibiigranuli]|uniref:helix-turn-helix transcriptional regulator n=1 Tax=Bifidobacterium tibiigranuli TaxID=2172043 RepID=UPI00235362CA|nr:LuxR family transcriptional regulator [Bifidobacterium tibiigranuli]MCH3975451.1 LuxR C-terminal-related transcriptional regulator [Bifidobacterium tibiigranuli]MCH4204190.1 LuxR C-terminal-related transcriptional regulator [Bifidobacterium tibiigranuli]MCH4274613.1 LuxR C-terminal-related transcriptional regulator [Bifidobacterium tibiigranuli]MCI1791342.1 LuxR C-terminal-related transcriptional regulator [Bifidobacterium tibiigranuli]
MPTPRSPPEELPEAVAARLSGGGSELISVTGLPGVGKTTWLRQFEQAADRFRVVSVSADAFEADFSFAFIDKVARAAGERAGVLAGVGEATGLEFSGVVRSLLSVLSRGTSGTRRLLVVIDNAQWIDDKSLRALRFVLGRLAFSGAGVVLSGHEPRTGEIAQEIFAAEPDAWARRQQIELAPLDARALRGYVSRVHGLEISLRLASRIRELSGGLPLYIDAVIAAMEPAPGETRSHWDSGVHLPARPGQAFAQGSADATPAVRHALEIAALLRDGVCAREVEAIAQCLGDTVDVEAAIAAGLLVRSAPGSVRPFHSLFAADIAEGLDAQRRIAILEAASAQVSNPHRALLCRLDAATARGDGLAADLLQRVRAAASAAEASGDPGRAIIYLRRAAMLADPAMRGELIVEACVLAGANFISPIVLDLLPELEALDPDPVRDLALLQTRQITGDVPWALAFVHELLAREPQHPDDTVLRMHITMMAVMVQLTTDDYTPVLGLLDDVRELAHRVQDEAMPLSDARLAVMPDAGQILLRATGLAVTAAARVRDLERVQREVDALSGLIANAEASPALADALTCRGGVYAGIGAVQAATADLEAANALAADGIVGWSLGHARVLLAYCWWLAGRTSEAGSMPEGAAVGALDSIDVSSRPLVFLLRAVLAAQAGDEDAYAENRRIAREVTVTDYDTFGAELELLAQVQHARMHGDAQAVLDALSPEALQGRWLAGRSIFTYRVDALAALGRAEEADRELAELHKHVGLDWSPIYGSMNWLEGRVAEAYDLPERALRAYRAAVRGADDAGAPAPRVRAQALSDAGRMQLSLGDAAGGARTLRQAAEQFLTLGARPAVRRALALIDDTDPAVLSGIESLSTREREIAMLVAQGRTNAQIAQSLYLATPTIAFHMRKVLAKLRLSSRRELSSVLA